MEDLAIGDVVTIPDDFRSPLGVIDNIIHSDSGTTVVVTKLYAFALAYGIRPAPGKCAQSVLSIINKGLRVVYN